MNLAHGPSSDKRPVHHNNGFRCQTLNLTSYTPKIASANPGKTTRKQTVCGANLKDVAVPTTADDKIHLLRHSTSATAESSISQISTGDTRPFSQGRNKYCSTASRGQAAYTQRHEHKDEKRRNSDAIQKQQATGGKHEEGKASFTTEKRRQYLLETREEETRSSTARVNHADILKRSERTTTRDDETRYRTLYKTYFLVSTMSMETASNNKRPELTD